MRIRIDKIELPMDYTTAQLLKAALKKVRCKPTELHGLHEVRRFIDAREGSPQMMVVAEADLSVKLKNGLRDVKKAKPLPQRAKVAPMNFSGPRPVVVGAGPAGLMAAFELAEAGMKPFLIERGEASDQRAKRVEAFWKEGTLNCESNVLYGEGGAGLFSDGKLTSRSKDRPRVRRFLEVLVKCGALRDILVDAEPHLGSDVLVDLVPAWRKLIISMGGEIRFGARLDRVEIEDGAVRGVVVNGEEIRTDCCVLATGHSARDIYEMLSQQGVPLDTKPFAVGVRLEIPQHRIDTAQWGQSYPAVGRASFRLTRREENNTRSCYTFCMCPGGLVIACASSEGLMTTNGMSLSQRDRPFGNAAFLVPVFPADFPAAAIPALAGLDLQREMETAAFAAGGSDYSLPAQRLVEFLEGAAASDLPAERSCGRARAVDLRGLLPDFVEQTLRSTIPNMLKGMPGIELDEALLYASETRSSSPVRVVRGEDGQSAVRGLYPCGEGSGYAGGIVSSGIDGLRLAESILASSV
ncbi:MAG: NAD(P)/FAD-dependent oxidoreductase [Kiritimatiellae bacterium]|jgi:uncharacterized FAD-dependent dehydrogenase|nr:NAD(P)/FAD-dependent oxidoreductase [Kiritimatiellia bacterium]